VKDRKAQMGIDSLKGVAIAFVVVALIVALGAQLLGEAGDDIGSDDCSGYWNAQSDVCQVNSTNTTALSSNSLSFNATADGVSSLAKISGKLGIIATAVTLIIVILIIVVATKNV